MRQIVLVLTLAMISAGCGLPRDPEDSFERIRTSRVLRAGLTAHPPWTADPAGGPEADLIHAFAASLGARVEWHIDSEAGLFERLEHFELDVVVGGLTADSPWAPKLGFSRPYVEAGGKQHVIAVAPGENRLLVEIERALKTHAPTVAARVGGKAL
ncbi:MAG: transporter substrate-binding domain-containing protein [Acidobacteriota bacterium]|nr:transporter substrate-binding domain-containing protein [Acidobacteriota bacterium]